jgi:hypothetical protein
MTSSAHVVCAEISEKLIADDGIHSLETFSGGGHLVLRGGGPGGKWDCGKRGNDGGDAATGAIVGRTRSRMTCFK